MIIPLFHNRNFSNRYKKQRCTPVYQVKHLSLKGLFYFNSATCVTELFLFSWLLIASEANSSFKGWIGLLNNNGWLISDLLDWLKLFNSFKYLGSFITNEGSKPEILSRVAQTAAALTRLKPVWIDKSISLSSKIRLMHSLVTVSYTHLTLPTSWGV